MLSGPNGGAAAVAWLCAVCLVACAGDPGSSPADGGEPTPDARSEDADADGGHGLTDGGGGERADAGSDASTGDDGGRESPLFGPHRVSVSAAELGEAMRHEVRCTLFDYVGGTRYLGSGACHSQGIAPTTTGVVTSCQDQEDHLGLLVRLDGSLADHGPAGDDRARWKLLHARDALAPRTHVVVGQGLEPLADEDLIPAVSSDSQSVPAEVALLDVDEPRCAFVHDPGAGDRHLGAASLTMVGGEVYLAACSWDCARFFVYRVDSFDGDCAPSLEAMVDVASRDDLRVDTGAGDDNWGSYNSLALLVGDDGDVFMLAGHDGWIDTWRLAGFPGPAITFRKLAKSEWGRNQADHGGRGMFYEGMALETPTERRIRLWTAPHDYGLDGCGDRRSCMRAIYQCGISL